MGIIYHSNGKEAWRGSPGDIVYHDNGKEAWGGELGDIVYHWNRKEAWRGRPGDIVYHDNGKELTRGGTSCLVNIGSGFLLTVTTTEATLLVNGTNIFLAKYKPKPLKECENCSNQYVDGKGYYANLRYNEGHRKYNFCSNECCNDFITSDDYEWVNENNLTDSEVEDLKPESLLEKLRDFSIESSQRIRDIRESSKKISKEKKLADEEKRLLKLEKEKKEKEELARLESVRMRSDDLLNDSYLKKLNDEAMRLKRADHDIFDIYLLNPGDNRVAVMKYIKDITGLGIQQVKEIINFTPSVLHEHKRIEECQEIKDKLEELGATVRIDSTPI